MNQRLKLVPKTFHLVCSDLYFVFGVPNLGGYSQPLRALMKISKFNFDNDSPVENRILGVYVQS